MPVLISVPPTVGPPEPVTVSAPALVTDPKSVPPVHRSSPAAKSRVVPSALALPAPMSRSTAPPPVPVYVPARVVEPVDCTSRVVPVAASKVPPVLAPPKGKVSVPDRTSTVPPRLTKGAWMSNAEAAPADLRSVPAFWNAPVVR